MLFEKEKLLGHFDGDEELIGDLLEIFESSYNEPLTKLKEALEQSDAKGVELHAHTLKGMLSNFFIDDLIEVAFGIEKMGRSGNLAGYEASYEKLASELPNVVTTIKASL